jgi:hypothetical protein
MIYYRDKRAVLYLRDLVCRFSLVSYGHKSNEDALLDIVMYHLERFPGPEYQLDQCAPVNYADINTMVEACVKRVVPAPGRYLYHLNYCNELLQWVILGLDRGEEPSWHLLVPHVEVTIPQLWTALEDLSESPLHRTIRVTTLIEITIYAR